MLVGRLSDFNREVEMRRRLELVCKLLTVETQSIGLHINLDAKVFLIAEGLAQVSKLVTE